MWDPPPPSLTSISRVPMVGLFPGEETRTTPGESGRPEVGFARQVQFRGLALGKTFFYVFDCLSDKLTDRPGQTGIFPRMDGILFPPQGWWCCQFEVQGGY